MTPTSLIREKPVRPAVRDAPAATRPPILTRAETAPGTCTELCERDHEND